MTPVKPPGPGGAPPGAAGPAPVRMGFRQCDPRFPFLWQAATQPAARWHGEGEGPAHYFADTPTGAWAELLRHEEITDPADLPGIHRALWAVELPGIALPAPALPAAVLAGDGGSWPACRAEAQRLRAAGHAGLEAPSAALRPGGAQGHSVGPRGLQPGAQPRDGRVWVFFGPLAATGWLAIEHGAPPAGVLPWVRPLTQAPAEGTEPSAAPAGPAAAAPASPRAPSALSALQATPKPAPAPEGPAARPPRRGPEAPRRR